MYYRFYLDLKAYIFLYWEGALPLFIITVSSFIPQHLNMSSSTSLNNIGSWFVFYLGWYRFLFSPECCLPGKWASWTSNLDFNAWLFEEYSSTYFPVIVSQVIQQTSACCQHEAYVLNNFHFLWVVFELCHKIFLSYQHELRGNTL